MFDTSAWMRRECSGCKQEATEERPVYPVGGARWHIDCWDAAHPVEEEKPGRDAEPAGAGQGPPEGRRAGMITGVLIDPITNRVAVELDEGEGGIVVVDPLKDGCEIEMLDDEWKRLK